MKPETSAKHRTCASLASLNKYVCAQKHFSRVFRQIMLLNIIFTNKTRLKDEKQHLDAAFGEMIEIHHCLVYSDRLNTAYKPKT